jgi:hypothetical protein
MPYGTVNADVIGTSVAGSNLGAGNASIMKNRLINGNFVISQYNSTSSVTPTVDATYVMDRWGTGLSAASKFSVQQNAGSVTPPVGFSNYLGATSLATTSLGATDYYLIYQKIEGFNTADLNWGTANAKTVTLSFQVYSSLTGTFGGSLANSAQSRNYPFSFTVSTANTWTSVSVTIAGDTTGTWIGATNGTGMIVRFSLGTGTTYSGTANAWTGSSFIFAPTGATSVVGTSGATFYITGVQLEVGSSATGFEYRLYNQELSACQRYYVQYGPYTPSGAGNNRVGIGFVQGTTAGNLLFGNVPMRTTPSTSYTGGVTVYGGSSGSHAITAVPGLNALGGEIAVELTISGGTAGEGCNLRLNSGSTDYISFSAEL